jgi:uncharacterized protein with FMN-binding domain
MDNLSAPPKRAHPAVTAVVVIVMIGMVAAAIVALNHKDSTSSTTATTNSTPLNTTTPTATVTPPTSASSSTYKDGTYSASTSYFTPDGQEDAKLTITIANNVVTASDFSEQALSGEGQRYQDRFDGNYKSEVVGQKVGDISLSRVAGASLTTDGFSQALEQIKQNAAS